MISLVQVSLCTPLKCLRVMSERYGHKILAGKFHFCVNYLKLVRSRNISLKQFELISFDVLVSPEEVFESFVEVDSGLTVSTNMYLALCERAK